MNEEDESKKIVEELIFSGFGTKSVKYAGKTWEFKTLSVTELNEAWAISGVVKDEVMQSLAYKLEVLKLAIVKINGVIVSDTAKELFDKLPARILDELYDEYLKISKLLVVTEKDQKIIMDMVENNSESKLKFTVMKEFGILPTEPRVQNLNEHQWMWLWYNIMRDQKDKAELRQRELDYLAFYINPELLNKVREARERDEKHGQKESLFNKNGVKVTGEHDEINPFNSNEITHYGATTVDEDFEAKLKLFMDEESPATYFDSDVQKGNSSESEEDFLTRAMKMQSVIEQENLKKLEQDAKEAGVNPDNLDGFEID